MQIKIPRHKKLFLSSIAGVLSVIFVFLISFEPSESSRRVSGPIMKKHTKGNFLKKPKSYFSVDLEANKSDSGDFELSVEVIPNQAFDNIELNWRLPDNVELIEGELVQELGALDPSGEYEYEILVRVNSDTPVSIIAEFSTVQDGIKLGGYGIAEIDPSIEEEMTSVQRASSVEPLEPEEESESDKDDVIIIQ